MDKVIKKAFYYLTVCIIITTSHLIAVKSEDVKSTTPLYRLRGIALFSGTDPFSEGIKIVTKSNYSHVGVVLAESGQDIDDRQFWHCFESVGTAEEVLKDHVLPHVRITPWEDVVQSYKNGMWLRTFKFNAEKEPTPQWVTEFVAKFNGKPYEKNFGELLGAINAKNKKTEIDSVFCSELVAEMLIEAKLMEAGISSNFTPHQFSTEYKLPLVGATLSPETIIHQPKRTGCCSIL